MYNSGFFKVYKSSKRVISVGNLNMGGTGKTPMVEYIIRLLEEKNIGVLSRGYGRKTRGFILANNKNYSSSNLGDECNMLINKFNNITLACDTNRVSGIKKLIEHNRLLEAVILDDGYQHRSLFRDINILLTEMNDLFVEDKLIPIGRLREPRCEKKRADIIVVTKCKKNIEKNKMQFLENKLRINSKQKIYFSYISKYNFIDTINFGLHKINKNQKHLLITGFEKTVELVMYLNEINLDFVHLKFKDHYDFKEKNINFFIKKLHNLDNCKTILLSEKDYYRISDKLINKIRKVAKIVIIQIEFDFICNDKQAFNNQILKLVK
tara:strand:+ start:4013 stop:4981 length:969 start_codon:yes stop_codon:yes gene_type:complete